MALIEWKEEYSVNVKEIDAQHKELIRLINRLNEAMISGEGSLVMGEILDSLVHYVSEHFRTEEKYFDSFSYEDKEAHKAEHAQLVRQVMTFVNDFKAGRTTISIRLFNFLKEWLNEHILGSDKKYTKCFNANGLS